MQPICPDVLVQLVGKDGNAFFIIGRVTKAMKHAGVVGETIEAFRKEAMAGDYDNLLRVCMKYVTISSMDPRLDG